MIKILDFDKQVFEFKQENQLSHGSFDLLGKYVCYLEDDKILGLARVIPLFGDKKKSEYSFAGHSLPEEILKVATEGSSLFIKKEHRGSEILNSLLKAVDDYSLSLGAKFLFGASEKRLFKLYDKKNYIFIEEVELEARGKKINSVLFYKELKSE